MPSLKGCTQRKSRITQGISSSLLTAADFRVLGQIVPRLHIRKNELPHGLRRIRRACRLEADDAPSVWHTLGYHVVVCLVRSVRTRLGKAHHLGVKIPYVAFAEVMCGVVDMYLVQRIAVPGDLGLGMIERRTPSVDNGADSIIRRDDALDCVGSLYRLNSRN